MTKKSFFGIAALAVLVGCGGKTINQVFDYQGWEWEKDCRSNIGRLYQGLQIYASDYDDNLPAADWGTTVFPYIKGERYYTCPALYQPGTTLAGYSMNADLYGVSTTSIPDTDAVVAFFESDVMVKGHAGDPDDILTTSRHAGSIFRIFMSGYVQNMEDLD